MSTTTETPKPEWVSVFKTVGKWFVVVVVGFFIAVVIVLAVYQSMDESGYIPHERAVDDLPPNWLVGENRLCRLVLETTPNGSPTGKLNGLQCPVGFDNLGPHNVTVTFRDMDGKVRRVASLWTCKQNSDGFTCKPVVVGIP